MFHCNKIQSKIRMTSARTVFQSEIKDEKGRSWG